jgi:hypothetical protein
MRTHPAWLHILVEFFYDGHVEQSFLLQHITHPYYDLFGRVGITLP